MNPSPMSRWTALTAAAAAVVVLGTALAGCSDRSNLPGLGAAAPGGLPDDAQAQIRGIDGNENGIRDSIESATGPMSINATDRLRLLAFAWSLQQGIEVAALGDDAALQRAAKMMADTTDCAMGSAVNTSIAKNLIDIYSLTVDSPMRSDAANQLKARTQSLNAQPSADSCAASDKLSASIVGQTAQKFTARNAATATAAASAVSNPTVAASDAASAASR